jgi:Biotin/lipoate A/B protein ligase family
VQVLFVWREHTQCSSLDSKPTLPPHTQDPLATGPSTPAATLDYAPSTHPTGDAAPFFAALTTRRLGRVLVTARKLPSTQALLQSAAGRAPPGAVAVAATQTAGKGRGANAWTSPEGCLAASLSTRCELPGTRLPFVQYVVSLAVLAAARAELVAAVEDGARGEKDADAAAAAVDAARPPATFASSGPTTCTWAAPNWRACCAIHGEFFFCLGRERETKKEAAFVSFLLSPPSSPPLFFPTTAGPTAASA